MENASNIEPIIKDYCKLDLKTVEDAKSLTKQF